MKSLEQEHMAFKQAMFKENIYLNHNYIRVSKACSPVLNMLEVEMDYIIYCLSMFVG